MFSISDEEIDGIMSDDGSEDSGGVTSPLAMDELDTIPHQVLDNVSKRAVDNLSKQVVVAVSKRAPGKQRQSASSGSDVDHDDDVSEVEHVEHAGTTPRPAQPRERRKAMSSSQQRPPRKMPMGLPRVESPPPPPRSRTRIADMERARAFYKPRFGKGDDAEGSAQKKEPPVYVYDVPPEHKEFFDNMERKRHQLSQGSWKNTFMGRGLRAGPPDGRVTVFKPTKPEDQETLDENPTMLTKKGWEAAEKQMAAKEARARKAGELKVALRGEGWPPTTTQAKGFESASRKENAPKPAPNAMECTLAEIIKVLKGEDQKGSQEDMHESMHDAIEQLIGAATIFLRRKGEMAQKRKSTMEDNIKKGTEISRTLSADIDDALARARAMKTQDKTTTKDSVESDGSKLRPRTPTSSDARLASTAHDSSLLKTSRLQHQQAIRPSRPRLLSSNSMPLASTPSPPRETLISAEPGPRVEYVPVPVPLHAPRPMPLFWCRPTQWTGMLSPEYPRCPKSQAPSSNPEPEGDGDLGADRSITPRPAKPTTCTTTDVGSPPDVTTMLGQITASGRRPIAKFLLLNLREGIYLLPRGKALMQRKGELFSETGLFIEACSMDIDAMLDEDEEKPFRWGERQGAMSGKVALSERELEFAMEEALPGEGWGLVYAHRRKAWYLMRPEEDKNTQATMTEFDWTASS